MKMKSIIFFTFLSINALYSSDWILELRGGYFYPISDKFRKIYKSGGPEVEVEVSRGFCGNWMGWGNVNYFQRDGRSIGLSEKTRIRMVPLSLGLKYQFLPCAFISPYLGIGATYTFIDVKNHSNFVKKHVNRGGFGFVVKSGSYFYLSECFLLDLFIDYYYQKRELYRNNADLSGLRMGLGLGYRF